MKRIITTIAAFLLVATMWAQSPEKMSYQAVIRDASNNLIVNQSVGMQISILQGGPSGVEVYVETQMINSNTNGLVSLEIGSGNVVSGNFSTIDWANDTYFIKTETDPTGGTNYSITGVSQMMSVPYAMHSKTADNVFSGDYNDLANSPTIPTNTSDLTNNSGFIISPNDADADTTNELQNLSLSGDSLSISNANSIDLSSFKNLKQMSLNVMGVFEEGSAYKDGGHSYHAGLVLPKSGTANSASFSTNFIIPDDYTPGDDIFIRMVSSSDSTGSVHFKKNYISVSRSGVGFISGSLSMITLNPLFQASHVPMDILAKIHSVNGPLQPGDAVSFGFFRYGVHATDNNPFNINIHGIELYY